MEYLGLTTRPCSRSRRPALSAGILSGASGKFVPLLGRARAGAAITPRPPLPMLGEGEVTANPPAQPLPPRLRPPLSFTRG
jgi:hypothetical protein